MPMRKCTALFLALMMVSLAGCGIETETYRTDTVIYIPAEPTTEEAAPVVLVTDYTVETEPSETETSEELVSETTKATTPKKTSGSSGKGSSSSSSTKKTEPTTKSTTVPTTMPVTEATTKATTEPTTKPTTVPTTAPTTVPTTAPTEATTVPTEPETIPSEESTEVPSETQPSVYDISGYSVGALETAMMNEINSYRAAEGLGELEINSWLCAIASARAYEACQSWSHTRPNGTYYTTVFEDYGYGCGASAENLLYTSGGEDAATLVARWMGSEGNRSSLMNAGFYTIGIGAYYDNGFTYLACLVVA